MALGEEMVKLNKTIAIIPVLNESFTIKFQVMPKMFDAKRKDLLQFKAGGVDIVRVSTKPGSCVFSILVNKMSMTLEKFR